MIRGHELEEMVVVSLGQVVSASSGQSMKVFDGEVVDNKSFGCFNRRVAGWNEKLGFL